MNMKHSDLIAIANSDLAEKLDQQGDLKQNISSSKSAASSFNEDIWKAVYTLNLLRYILGISFLIIIAAPSIDPQWNMLKEFNHPRLFFYITIALLISAVIFSYLTRYRDVEFNVLASTQFSLDLVLTMLITHSAGSIASNLALFYVIVVATGSVVLPRKHALGLAAGAIILLFSEHLFSVWQSDGLIQLNSLLLTLYGFALFGSAALISYLAERIRLVELQKFIPGDEPIDEFLVREEINALKAALEETNGNKTEAAKLLGMSFRSFRYKFTKYDIG